MHVNLIHSKLTASLGQLVVNLTSTIYKPICDMGYLGIFFQISLQLLVSVLYLKYSFLSKCILKYEILRTIAEARVGQFKM